MNHGSYKMMGRRLKRAADRRLRLVLWWVGWFLIASLASSNASAMQVDTEVAAIGRGDLPIVDPIVAPEEIDTILDQPEQKIATDGDRPSGINLLSLFVRGGNFMIPIAVMSLLVVALAIERTLALRRRKILPRPLWNQLKRTSREVDTFSPTAAAALCDEYPSPASRVIRAMLERTGRPLSEIERAASETINREADRSNSPIRWLSLAAAATPLMGLLGTVWGMIVAFHESTTLTPDRSRSEQLSEGIYTALVTTLAGLAVAIPAAILALYLENRLLKMYRRVEELAFAVAPGLSRFTGVQRMDPDGRLQPIEPDGNVGHRHTGAINGRSASSAPNPPAGPPVPTPPPVVDAATTTSGS